MLVAWRARWSGNQPWWLVVVETRRDETELGCELLN